jgi:hypothetical protein
VNDYLLSTSAVAVIMIICVVAFLFVARLVLRVAIKAAFALAIVFALLLTGVMGWWRGWFFSSTSARPPANQTDQPRNVNRGRR